MANRDGGDDSGSRLFCAGGHASCSASRGLLFGSFAAGLAAALLFALNPNMLYLQATPMSEPVYLAMVAGVVFFTIRGNAVAAALFSCGASLTRYEGWALIPVVALVLLFTRGFRSAADLRRDCLGTTALLAGHNWWYYGNALEFYNGPYSAKMIYERAVAGKHAAISRRSRLAEGAPILSGGSGVVRRTGSDMDRQRSDCWRRSFERAWWALAMLDGPACVFRVEHVFIRHADLYSASVAEHATTTLDTE